MNTNQEVVAELGRSLGIEGLAMPEGRPLALRFDRRGSLYVEDRDEILLVYLARDIDLGADRAAVLEKALGLCHYSQGLAYPVHPGLRAERTLVFLVRLPSEQVTLPEIERVLELLSDLHEKVRA
ncbi:MAG: CesT family type III secretion system chaperone [Chromatiaceae bacterium]|nr:CesT family type III secretion system chaperone [Chromatiaceae bacterium]MCP5315836.1 CesT family type III secretion system chaperone [Chromatiaceae bacterium]